VTSVISLIFAAVIWFVTHKHELEKPNQTLKPTQHFVVSSRSMHASILKVLGGLSLSR
jgi:hypothetical protein